MTIPYDRMALRVYSDLVKMKFLIKTGKGKNTEYKL